MAGSEIADFRHQQAMQEAVARQGLYGVAAVARHDFIEKRMEQAAASLIHLMKEGKLEQVEQALEQVQTEIQEGKERSGRRKEEL
jgi:hypothetical protein